MRRESVWESERENRGEREKGILNKRREKRGGWLQEGGGVELSREMEKKGEEKKEKKDKKNI